MDEIDFESITSELLKEQDEKISTQERTRIDACKIAIESAEVETTQQANEYMDFVIDLRKQKTNFEKHRAEIIKPLLEQQRKINSEYSQIIEEIEEMEKKASSKLHEWMKKQREINPDLREIKTDKGCFFTKKTWDFEVDTIEALPTNYLKVDTKILKEDVKKGMRDIPGVWIFEKEETQLRAASKKEDKENE